MPHEPRPERDEDDARELDQERDTDRQPLDRDEVQPLDDSEREDPVEREERQIALGNAELVARQDGEPEREPDERPGRSKLRVVDRGQLASRQRHLRDGPVHGEEDRRDERHRVPEPGAAVVLGRAGKGKRGIDHGPAGYPPRLCASGCSSAW